MKKRLIIGCISAIALVSVILFIMMFVRPNEGEFTLDYDNLNDKKKVTDMYETDFGLEYGKLYFEVIESPVFGDGEVRFTGYYGSSEVKIPEEIWLRKGIYPRKFKVTEVDFSKTSKEASFIIPKTVKKICEMKYGNKASLCNGLTYAYSCNSGIKVVEDNPYFDSRDNCNCIIETKTNKLLLAAGESSTIPSTVTEIGSFAFWNVKSDIVIPGNVKKIDSYAFMNSDTKSITISEGVEDIEQMAFCSTKMDSSTLQYLYLPSTLKTLYLNSFLGYIYPAGDPDYYYNGKDLKDLIPDYEISIDRGICFSYGTTIHFWSATPFLEYIFRDDYFTYMYYYSENTPSTSGHFFHFVDGVITKWA